MQNDLLTKKDFVNAAKLLDKEGHIKGGYQQYSSDDPKGFCGAGALGMAALGRPPGLYPHHFPEKVREVLKIKHYEGEAAIMEFNDKRSTTKEDVQTLLLLLGEIAARG